MERVLATTRTGHSDYWALKHSAGILYALEILEATAADGVVYIKGSIDDGATWYEAASFAFKSGLSGSVDCFFERPSDGSIWISTQDKNLQPAANRNSYHLLPSKLRSPIAGLSGG
jgi:hypothetical protein